MLLQQNIQAEVIATDLARSTAESRGRLENQLRAANESLLQAEKNEAGLRLALGSAQRDAAASIAAEQSTAITRAMAEGIVDVVVAAAIAAGEEREHSRAIIEGIVSSADERVDSAQRRAAVRVSESSVEKAAAERILQGSTLSALHVENASREKIGDARLDANRFQHEAGRAREAEERAKDETHVARDKIAALEAKIEKSERMHALFRERAELRLETLRSAVEEEDVEHGTQVCRSMDSRSIFENPCTSRWNLRPGTKISIRMPATAVLGKAPPSNATRLQSCGFDDSCSKVEK